jgi:hypothetical protein
MKIRSNFLGPDGGDRRIRVAMGHRVVAQRVQRLDRIRRRLPKSRDANGDFQDP